MLQAVTEGRLDDRLLPFAIEGANVRGRIVRLGPVLDDILSAHAYPEPVAKLLGEVLALTALLGSMLDDAGILTVQAKADGAVSLLVADYRDAGALRGYAAFNPEAIAALGDAPTLEALLGKGYLALSLENRPDEDAYQGIVDLAGDDIAACARHYFAASEQIPTELHLGVGRGDDGGWRAAGLLLQHLAKGEQEGRLLSPDQRDDWRRLGLLMRTVRDSELLDGELASGDILYRLFHEEGVRVFPTTALSKGCRCSAARIETILARFPAADRADMVVDGKISVDCQFCSKSFVFEP